MIILTSYTSGTYKAQIRSSPDKGFKQLYTATCTMGELTAARMVVKKQFGPERAETVKQLKDERSIRALTGDFFSDPQRKQVFNVWTFDQKSSPLTLAAAATKKPKAIDGKAAVVAQDDLPSLGASIAFIQEEIDEIGRKAMRAALPLKLRQGLACLKAQALFAINDHGDRNKTGKNQHTKEALSDSDQASEEPSDEPASFSDWISLQPLTKGSAYDYMRAVQGLGLDHQATDKQLDQAYKTAREKAGDDLSIAKLKHLAPPKDQETEDPNTPESRAAEAREQAHHWITAWDRSVKAGNLEDADAETLRQLDEFLTSARDHVRKRLKSAK